MSDQLKPNTNFYDNAGKPSHLFTEKTNENYSSNFQINNRVILTVRNDGTLIFGEAVTPREVAKAIMEEWGKLREDQLKQLRTKTLLEAAAAIKKKSEELQHEQRTGAEIALKTIKSL